MGAGEIIAFFVLLLGGRELLKPRVPGDVQQQVANQVSFLLAVYNQRHGTAIPIPRITFDFRDSNFYASSSFSKWRIRFNPAKVNSQYGHVYSVTTRHELAHLVNRYLNGTGPLEHGDEWRDIFETLGGDLAEAVEDRVQHVE